MRARRSKAEMAEIREGLFDLATRNRPCTVRQVFYLAVSTGLIDKTEAEYKGTVCRLLAEGRLNGELGWNCIVDHTRQGIHLRASDSLSGALEDTARHYRRRMWAESPYRVEIWCEKQTLIGSLRDECLSWDVGLFPTRGYPSLTFLHDCAEDIEADEKETYIYYVGDYDPSGENIAETVERRICEFAPDADIRFEKICITPTQIDLWKLPTRPTKSTDTRAVGFLGESVDVEAVPPHLLRDLVTGRIERHIDPDEWHTLKVVEASERKILDYFRKSDFETAEITEVEGAGSMVLTFGQ